MRARSAFLLVALAAPITGAQSPGPPPHVAFLTSEGTCATNLGLQALVEGLTSLGYRAGTNISIECRSAEGRYERLDALAAELLQGRPAVLVTAAAPASLAASRTTANVPIVSIYTADPISLGLVKSFARPDGNVTGISALASDYVAKSLQLLRETAPGTTRVGVLGHSANATYAIYARELEAAARALDLTLDFAGVATPAEIDAALSSLHRRGAQVLRADHVIK